MKFIGLLFLNEFRGYALENHKEAKHGGLQDACPFQLGDF